MKRKDQREILEQSGLSPDMVFAAYRDLAQVHHWLGDTAALVHAIRRDPKPVSRILDIGCGLGFVSHAVARELGVDVVGVDIRSHSFKGTPIDIVRADATRDPLPCADVAFSMNLGHHLSEGELQQLIRNVGLFCRRFLIVDLVRHWLPLVLFRSFVAPLICPIDAEDGQRSIRRSYTPQELRRIATSALSGTGGTFCLDVARLNIRQLLDISYSSETSSGASIAS